MQSNLVSSFEVPLEGTFVERCEEESFLSLTQLRAVVQELVDTSDSVEVEVV